MGEEELSSSSDTRLQMQQIGTVTIEPMVIPSLLDMGTLYKGSSVSRTG